MGDLVNMEAFRGVKPAAQFAKDDPMADRLSAGIGSGYPVISYRGKRWFLRYKGESYQFVRPDDRTELMALEMVILAAAPNKSKSYYAAWSEDNEGSRPLCASINGEIPDSDVPQRQANSCAICPRNEFRVHANGRKGKECQDYKRLAVMISPHLTQAAVGHPILEPIFLRVPAASLQGLAKMGDDMAHQGWAYHTYVCRVEFEPMESYPKMRFTEVRPVPDADAAFIDEKRHDPQTRRITHGDTFGMRTVAPPETATIAPLAAPVIIASSAAIPPLAPPVPVSTLGFAAAAAAAKPLEGEIMPPPEPAATPSSSFAAAAKPQLDTTIDLGATTESDAALDAKIAQEITRLGLK